jgi:hypothetical protein
MFPNQQNRAIYSTNGPQTRLRSSEPQALSCSTTEGYVTAPSIHSTTSGGSIHRTRVDYLCGDCCLFGQDDRSLPGKHVVCQRDKQQSQANGQYHESAGRAHFDSVAHQASILGIAKTVRPAKRAALRRGRRPPLTRCPAGPRGCRVRKARGSDWMSCRGPAWNLPLVLRPAIDDGSVG